MEKVGSNSSLVQECVRICWDPGHSEVDGNEVADKLARKGAATSFIGPEPQCGVNWSTVKGAIEQWSSSQCVTYWDNLSGHRQSKLLGNPYNERKTLELSKSELRLLVEYFTGHNSLRYHQYNIGLSKERLCRLGVGIVAIPTGQHNRLGTFKAQIIYIYLSMPKKTINPCIEYICSIPFNASCI